MLDFGVGRGVAPQVTKCPALAGADWSVRLHVAGRPIGSRPRGRGLVVSVPRVRGLVLFAELLVELDQVRPPRAGTGRWSSAWRHGLCGNLNPGRWDPQSVCVCGFNAPLSREAEAFRLVPVEDGDDPDVRWED